MSWGERAIIKELKEALLTIHQWKVEEGSEKETILAMKKLALGALRGTRDA